MSLYFLSGTEPTVPCSYHEANNILLEIAKDRLRKSNYSTGQAPVDIVKQGVFLDPRIFEDPEPSKKKRQIRKKPQSTEQPDEDEVQYSDTVLQPDAEVFTSDEPAVTDIPAVTAPYEEDLLSPQPAQDNKTPSEVVQPHTETNDEPLPAPSSPLPESGSEVQENDGIIQEEGINPWL